MAGDARRIALEIFVIVGSILLAFWIEAAWARSQEQEVEHVLLEEILADLEAADAYAVEVSGYVSAVQTENLAFIQKWSEGFPEMDRDSAFSDLGDRFRVMLWEPPNEAYSEARASGNLRLIESEAVRLGLSKYSGSSANLARIADFAGDIYTQHVIPWVNENVSLSDLADRTDRLLGFPEKSPFPSGISGLYEDRELWNLLTSNYEINATFVEYVRVFQEVRRCVADHIRLELGLELETALEELPDRC